MEKKFIIEVQEWIVKLAKETNLDIQGFKHRITSDFKNHVLKSHGNIQTEEKRGQVPVTVSEIEKVETVIRNPDFAISGLLKNGEPRIILVKNEYHGKILVEEILPGNKNKCLNAKTFWIMENEVLKTQIEKIFRNNNQYECSKMKFADAVVANSTV